MDSRTITEKKMDCMWRMRIIMYLNMPQKFTAWMTKKFWKLFIDIQNPGKGKDLGWSLERIRMF